MKFTETFLADAYVIDIEPHSDSRGYFGRTYCKKEFEKIGFKREFVQTNISFSSKKHTLRGMHFQTDGSEEDKLVMCVQGKILDVIIDLRKDSKTYCRHFTVELSDENNKMILIPRGFAHGYITLTDDCKILYQVSNYYSKENERGVRWDDPAFGIDWPVKHPIISEKDANHPSFNK